nr:DUF262 domain-containing protein [Olegusella massiliensis]
MHADTATIVGLVTPVNLRFVVPVYQRPYTWGLRECAQLWDDIVTVGRTAKDVRLRSEYGGRTLMSPSHFTGSIVWVQDGAVSTSGVESRLLIDGQQRVTTLMLVFVALARYAHRHPERSASLSFSAQEILDDGYLTNKHRDGHDHYKLTLSKGDRELFQALIDALESDSAPEAHKAISAQGPHHLLENLAYFERQLEHVDVNSIWLGIQQLQVASIALTEGQDNPQLVFESMNSTGKDLSSADLVRNFILMSAPIESQESLYRSFWQPIEQSLDTDNDAKLFENFLHDWLTASCAPQTFERSDIYGAFKRYVRDGGYSSGNAIITLINQLRRTVRSYVHITQGQIREGCDPRPEIDTALADLRKLNQAEVNPLLLFFHDAYDQQDIDAAVFEKSLRITESYLMRRLVCNCSSEGMKKFFSQLIARLEGVRAVGGDFVVAYASYLLNEESSSLRFPADDEFCRALALRKADDWDATTAIGLALQAGDKAPVRWVYPQLSEATRAIYRRSL